VARMGAYVVPTVSELNKPRSTALGLRKRFLLAALLCPVFGDFDHVFSDFRRRF